MKSLIPAGIVALFLLGLAIGFYFGRATAQPNIIVTRDTSVTTFKYLVNGKTGEKIAQVAP